MKSILFSLLLASVTTGAFANANDIARQLANPQNSPYEILKAAFEKAGPATIADFPNYDLVRAGKAKALNSLSWVSLETKQSELKSAGPTVLISADIVVEKGTPANGPLFPGTQDKVVKVKAISQLICPLNDCRRVFQYTAEELLKINGGPTSLVDTDEGVVVIEGNNTKKTVTIFKKSGDLIWVRSTVYAKEVIEKEAYSYLWK